ncbi:hypothetical protein CENA302_10380 [Cylindrospermopsis raciborskii CENA302]|uniref:Uncharacterized protein n=1 Tax=Cylindrospermopsis raciborskii CENA302 TaxID=1170768 RepID=A0A9Q5W906_9CYAN|nr:hypothetical protein CENA302_10380 [Cylindrospermopsis raciborskii CENA302]
MGDRQQSQQLSQYLYLLVKVRTFVFCIFLVAPLKSLLKIKVANKLDIMHATDAIALKIL